MVEAPARDEEGDADDHYPFLNSPGGRRSGEAQEGIGVDLKDTEGRRELQCEDYVANSHTTCASERDTADTTAVMEE